MTDRSCRPRRPAAGFAAFLVVLFSFAVAAVASAAGPASGAARSGAHPGPDPVTLGTRLVGHLDLGATGFNADVWAHRDVAYVGGYGIGDICPGHGVRTADLSDPTEPRLLSAFAGRGEFPGTTSEDVWVGWVGTPAFTGDLAAVGLQVCGYTQAAIDSGTFRGLALYDVSDPARPRQLATVPAGAGVRGVHELDGVRRPDGTVLVLASVPGSYRASGGQVGDVRIIDVSDPHSPRQVADWDLRRDGPRDVRETAGGLADSRVHSVKSYDSGRKAVVYHWDAGAVFLDLTDAARPRYLGRTTYGAGDEGNAHSGAFLPGERIFVLNDEVGPFPMMRASARQREWGYQRLFDVTDPARPQPTATFATDNALAASRDGFYSVHNNVIVGRLSYASWYSDGVRVVDVSDPAGPRQVGAFVPPATADPHGYWKAPDGTGAIPLVWGVHVHRGLVLASDINSGLWIVQRERPRLGLARPL